MRVLVRLASSNDEFAVAPFEKCRILAASDDDVELQLSFQSTTQVTIHTVGATKGPVEKIERIATQAEAPRLTARPMYDMLRSALGIQVRVSPEEALERARTHWLERGWVWDTPNQMSFGLRSYRFTLFADSIGAITGYVDCETGHVRAKVW